MDILTAIIPAAGCGKRFAAGKNKLFLLLGDQPILGYGISLLSRRRDIGEILIAAARGEEEMCGEIAAAADSEQKVRILTGGKERMDSVAGALAEAKYPLVMVHDGARPLLTEALIDRLLAAFNDTVDGVIPVLPLGDTIKEGDGALVSKTVDRSILWAAQTPQLFRTESLLSAYAHAREKALFVTDDASLVEAKGGRIAMVPGSDENIKITRPFDLDLAELILQRRSK